MTKVYLLYTSLGLESDISAALLVIRNPSRSNRAHPTDREICIPDLNIVQIPNMKLDKNPQPVPRVETS